MATGLKEQRHDAVGPLVAALQNSVSGQVRADRLYRALYATDASLYQIVPDAVVLPRTVADVASTVRICAAHRVPLTARGAGTGLTGGAVNRGVQLDCSRYLNRILHIDPEARTVRVEAGVVLDELNAVLAPHGLHFAPDVATGSRATIGGMIANNSCGAHSVLYGRTVDHLLDVDVVLSDGSTWRWGTGIETGGNPLARRCEETLAVLAGDLSDEIESRYPKVMRRNGGYGLDRLRIEGSGRLTNPETIVCGSEGTLCIIVGATLRLTPLPRHKGLLVAHFDDLLAALEHTPAILEHGPAAVELVDKLILDAAFGTDSGCVPRPLWHRGGSGVDTGETPVCVRRTGRPVPRNSLDAFSMQVGSVGQTRGAAGAAARRRSFIEGDPQAVLMIEFYDEKEPRLRDRLHSLESDLRRRRAGYAWSILTDPMRQANVWNVRQRGLGLLMSRPGDDQPYAFVEDTAVDPARLRDYIGRFGRILADEGIERVGYYAHASAGCLHVRPVLNLTQRQDVARMKRIADRISSLVLEFGGTMTGEHGDGIVRSCWLEKMYGPRIVEAFGTIKRTFDPNGILNPGKIVDPLPMTENLRYETRQPPVSDHPAPAPARGADDTAFDFSAYGGMAGLAGMCSGVGQCRQRLVGTMCPSYMATAAEEHSTRGRANALRIALSDVGLLSGLEDPALDEVMDLCLSCKACKTQCPTGVDMARLKSAWLAVRHHTRPKRRARGFTAETAVPQSDLWHRPPAGVNTAETAVPQVPYLPRRRRRRLIGASAELAAWGSLLAPLSSGLLQSRPGRALMERFFGLDRRVALPRFARQTFRQWFARHRRGRGGGAGRRSQEPIPRLRRRAGVLSQARGLCHKKSWDRLLTDIDGRTGNGNHRERRVVYFVDTWTNYFTPQVGVAAVGVLEALGCQVIVPPVRCCGRPLISHGLLSKAKRLAEQNVAILACYAASGIPIVGTEPSCLLTLTDELPQFVRTSAARQAAQSAMLIETFISRAWEQGARSPADEKSALARPVLYHGHCHQKALVGTADAMRVLRACTGGRASEINSGCCGMAGSFGHEVEHYDVARAVGEQRLFPAVRERGDADLAISGFSCRHQIEHHTAVCPRHVVEFLAEAICPRDGRQPRRNAGCRSLNSQ